MERSQLIDRLPSLCTRYAHVKQALQAKLVDHDWYIRERGEDMPEVRDWK